MDANGAEGAEGDVRMISETRAAQSFSIQGPAAPVDARLRVPGDKSISHRAAMFGAIADGSVRIRNFLPATDCLATLEVVRGLGIEVEYSGEEVLVHGRGLHGLS